MIYRRNKRPDLEQYFRDLEDVKSVQTENIETGRASQSLRDVNHQLGVLRESLKLCWGECAQLLRNFQQQMNTTIETIVAEYEMHIEGVRREHQQYKEEVARNNEMKNAEYRRILDALNQKEEALEVLEQKILAEQLNSEVAVPSANILKMYQQEILSLNSRISSLNLALEVKTEKNKLLAQQLTKYKIVINTEEDKQNDLRWKRINTDQSINILGVRDVQQKCEELFNRTAHLRELPNRSSSNQQSSKTLSINDILNHQMTKSNRKLQIQEVKYKAVEKVRPPSVKSIDKVSKQFKNALKQYNWSKKERVAFYLK